MLEIKDLAALEKQQQEALKELKTAIIDAVKEAPPLEGVTPISSSPACAMVSSSALFASENLVLSPAFYQQGSQARIVEKVISPLTTSTRILEKVKEMVEKKKAGADNEPLNKNTVEALRPFISSD